MKELIKLINTIKKKRIILMTTKAKKLYHKFIFRKNDILLFGRESAGVPKTIHDRLLHKLKIPMNKKTRSLNVAMSVAISSSEALKQNKLFLRLKKYLEIIINFQNYLAFCSIISFNSGGI